VIFTKKREEGRGKMSNRVSDKWEGVEVAQRLTGKESGEDEK